MSHGYVTVIDAHNLCFTDEREVAIEVILHLPSPPRVAGCEGERPTLSLFCGRGASIQVTDQFAFNSRRVSSQRYACREYGRRVFSAVKAR